MLAILLVLRKGCQIQLFVVLLHLGFWLFEDMMPLSDNSLADWQPFQITLLLEQQLFFGGDLFQKLGEERAIDTYPLSAMLALLLSPFVEDQLPFSLRTPLDLEKGVGGTPQPLSVDKGIGDAHIKRLIAHRHTPACLR